MEPIFPANPLARVGWYGGRIAHGFWGEPLNLASNLLFIVFFVIFWVKLRREKSSDTAVFILVILGGLIGVGSAVFHGHPNKVTLQMDLIPITIFGLAYVFFTMRRFLNYTYKISLLGTFAFMVCTKAFELAVKSFKIPGTSHIPSLAALTLIGVHLFRDPRYRGVGSAFLTASGFYILALFFRYFDLYVYRAFPLGTHFLWHLNTASVVGVLLYAAVTYKNIQGKVE